MAFTTAEIEDGTGKPGAKVYGSDSATVTTPITDAEAFLVRECGKTAFASLTGTVSAGSVTVDKQEFHCLRGTRYVELLAYSRVVGRPSVDAQALLQPRYGQYLDGDLLSSSLIPIGWLRACYEGMELSASGKLLFDVSEEKRSIKREKTGQSLETEYFQGSSSQMEIHRSVMAHLEPFLETALRLQRTA